METGTFKIETKKVPMPTPGTPRSSGKYPFVDMKVGDSFFAPLSAEANLRNAASIYGKRLKRVFTVRKVRDEKEVGLRVWRTK